MLHKFTSYSVIIPFCKTWHTAVQYLGF